MGRGITPRLRVGLAGAALVLSLLGCSEAAEESATGSGGEGGSGSTTAQAVGPQAVTSVAGSASSGTALESEGTAFVLPPAGESMIGDVEVTSSGDLVLAGTRANVPFVARVGTDGVVEWILEQPTVDAAAYWHVKMLDDGSFALGGGANEDGGSVPAVARVGAGGELLWARAFDAEDVGGWSVTSVAVEGDQIVASTSEGVVRFTSGGELVSWLRPARWDFDVGLPIPAQGATSYLLGTRRAEKGDAFDGWLAHLGADGEVLWQRWYEQPGAYAVSARVVADDNSLILAGSAFPASEGFVARFTAVGDLAWTRRLSWAGGYVDVVEMLLDTNGDVVVVGTLKHDNLYQHDLFQLRLSADGEVLETFVLGDDWFTVSHAAALLDERVVIVGATSVGALVMVTDPAGAVGGCSPPYRFRSQAITVDDADFVLSEADVVVEDLQVAGEGLVVYDVRGLAPGAAATEPLCEGRL